MLYTFVIKVSFPMPYVTLLWIIWFLGIPKNATLYLWERDVVKKKQIVPPNHPLTLSDSAQLAWIGWVVWVCTHIHTHKIHALHAHIHTHTHTHTSYGTHLYIHTDTRTYIHSTYIHTHIHTHEAVLLLMCSYSTDGMLVTVDSLGIVSGFCEDSWTPLLDMSNNVRLMVVYVYACTSWYV